MTLDPAVPITKDDLDSIIKLIQLILKDDEAGPGFFYASQDWIDKTKYRETPF